MNIYYYGAHRTGKTTKAKELAESCHQLDYCKLPTSKVISDFKTTYDYQSKGNDPIQVGIVHKALFDYFYNTFNMNRNTVFDRSLIDVLAYWRYHDGEFCSTPLYESYIQKVRDLENSIYIFTVLDKDIIPQKEQDKQSDFYMSFAYRSDIQLLATQIYEDVFN